jgi:hypothetical protein
VREHVRLGERPAARVEAAAQLVDRVSPSSAAARSVGTSTTRGSSSGTSSTSTRSPAATPVPSRASRFRPTKVRPPMRAIVVRNVWPLIVTRTGARTLPRTALGSNGTWNPSAGDRSTISASKRTAAS